MGREKPLDPQIQHALNDEHCSALNRYALLAVGQTSIPALIRYEVTTGLWAATPGAFGYWARRKFYRPLMGSLGKDVILGKNITLRGCNRIHIGNRVAIDDNVVLDARDQNGTIVIEDGSLISRNTIVRARNGLIRIGAGSDIGANCILATDQELVIGENVLVAAFTYVCAGGHHAYDRTDVPIIAQGFIPKGGIRIGDDVWIGSHSTVLDGVTIESGTIVGAHSLVNSSLPRQVIAWGQPAQERKSRVPK
jgi:acetyltransferase-like isoleucine patch superfamily enzyme